MLFITALALAQPTAYWRGGSGNYNDPTKWSNVSGGAPSTFTASNGGSIPVSGDNIVFDNLSSAAAFTVTVPANSQCLGMLVTATCPTLNISVNGGFNFQIYGNTAVNTDNFQFTNSGSVEFYDGVAGTQTINILYNPASSRRVKFLTAVNFSAGDHYITNVFKCNRSVGILTGNTSTTFNDSCFQLTAGGNNYVINANAGIHTFNKYLHVAGTLSISSQNTLNINCPMEVSQLLTASLSNNITINAANQIHRIAYLDFSFGTNINANFSNSMVKMVALELSSSATNTVNFSNTALHVYQTVKSQFTTNSYFSSGNVGTIATSANRKPYFLVNKAISARSLHVFESDFIYSFQTAVMDTYDTTIFYNGNIYILPTITAVNKFLVNKHLQLNSGVYLQCDMDASNTSATLTSSISLASGASFSADASCSGSIRMRDISLKFANASPSYTCNGLTIDNSRNIGATLNAGAGSYKIPGSNTTGWTFGATPTPRILRWTGTVTPASFYQYKRWHQSASWQNVTTGVTPECPPTIYDSIIFPNNSFVRIDEPNSVCHGMNWQGTGTIYDSTYATVGSTVAIAGHWGVSPSNTGIVMYNKNNRLEIYGTTTIGTPANVNWWFNGRVYFRAWEPNRFLNPGRQQFRNSVVFDATSDVGGWFLTDSLFAHYSNEGQYGAGTTVFATSPKAGSGAYSLVHYNGHLNTNGFTVRVTDYVRAIKTPEYISSLKLSRSKFYVMGHVTPGNFPVGANFLVERSVKFRVIADTSEIVFRKHTVTANATPAPFFGGGYKYNNLTFKCNRGGIMSGRNNTGTLRAFTDTFNLVTFENNANIYASSGISSGSFAVNAPPFTENMIAKKILFNTVSGNTEIGNTWVGVLGAYTRQPLRILADSVYYFRDANIDTTTITYNNLSVMTPGMIYNFYYSRHLYPSASIMQGLGLCSNPITLNKGVFFNNSGADFESSITNLTSFNVGGVISSGTDSLVFINSLLTSAVSGKAIVRGGGSRVLVWRDNVAGVSTGNWNDQSKWALATITSTVPSGSLPFTFTVGATGQCVPSCIDTVIFDASSFDANDVVHLPDNYTGYFHTMRWATGMAVTPTFSVNMRKGAKLNVCGSLYLQNNLTFNNSAYTLFTGNTVNDTIDALGKSVCDYVARFEASGTNVNWTLKSNALFAPNSFTTVTQPATSDSVNLQLVRGHLNVNGKLLQTAHFHSIGSLNRKLSLPTIINGAIVSTSTLNIVGGNQASSTNQVPTHVGFGTPLGVASRYQYIIDDGITNTFTLNASPSSLLLFQRITTSTVSIDFSAKYGNNQSYGFVKFNNAGTIKVNGNCYNTSFESMELNSLPSYSVTLNNHAFGSNLGGYTTNYYNHIKKLTSNNQATSDAFNLFASGTLIDTIMCEGGVNIYDTTAIKNYFKFIPGATYKFPHNRVTYLYNQCDFKPIGLPSKTIIFLSTLSGTKAWIRKDTGIVCADYCSVTDNWAVGSGLSMPAFGTGGSFPGGNGAPIAACTATPGPWRCDTVLASSYYTGTNSGPALNANTSQNFGKRSIFNGGTNFTIGPNTYGWEKTPNPPTPQVSIVSPNITLCEGDSVRITFTFIGTGPFQNFNYFYNTNSAGGYPTVSNQTITAPSTIGIPSYTASPSFTYIPGVFPGDTIKPTDPSQPYTTFGTVSNPWIYSFWVYPTQSIKYSLGTIAVDRCFNSISVTGTGSMVVTVNPAPKNLAASLTSNPICNYATAVITSTATQTGNNYYLYSAPTGTTGITLMNSSTTGTLTTGTYTTGALTTGTTATTYSYYVGAESQLGCPSLTRTPVTVTVNPTATVQIAATSLNPICDGQSSVITVTTNATSGVQMYNAATGGSLLGTLSSNSISVNPTAGTYTYYLQANNSTTGCNATGTRPSVTLTVNPTPTMSSATNTTICSGNTLNFGLTSNIAGSTYEWFASDNTNVTGESTSTQITSTVTDAITNNVTTLQQVIYTVTPTSTLGSCIGASQTVTVNVNPTPAVTSANTATTCSGAALNLGLTSNVASTYTWVATSNTNVTGESVSNVVSNTINNTLVTAAGGAVETVLYTVTPMSSAGNCLGTAQQVTVTVNPTPTVAAIAANSGSICANTSGTIQATGGNTYTWSPSSNISTTSGNEVTFTAPSSTNAVTYTYNIVTTNTTTGCNNLTSPYTVSVTGLGAPIVTSASTNTVCSGVAVNMNLTSSSASTFNWLATDNSNTNGESIIAQSTATLADAITNTTSVIQNVVYTVTPTSTLGSCLGTPKTVTISVNPTPQISSANTATLCSGNSLNIGLTSNVASTYTWVATSNTNVTGESTSNQTTNTINNTLSTSVGSADEVVLYTVTPMSSAGNCLGTAQQVSVTVNSSPNVTAVSSSSAICSGNTATLTAAGADTYTWTSGPASDTYTVATTGTYLVTGTNTLTGCTNTTNVSLLVNPTPTVNISASSGTICAGATATLTAATANGYVWSTSSTANTTTVMPMSTTVYTVTGTNTAGSCTATAQFTVNVNPKPDMTLTNTTSIVCLGDANGTATVNTTNGTSGYNYTWTGSASTNSVATLLSSGPHTVQVTDARGCKDTLLVTISAPSSSLAIAIATSTTGCGLSNGTATVTATGGWNSGYTYVWQANASTTNTATAYAAGPYTVQVTDANGCSKVQSFTINNPSTPTISAVAANPTICSGLTTTITPSGAVSYTITGGAVSSSTVGTSFEVNPTSNATYSIVGTDASNCISSAATVSINVNTTPTVAISATNNTICIGQSATLNLSGATTYTLLNTNAPITSGAVFSPTTNTTYSVQGATGTCTSLATQQVITVNALPVVTAVSSSSAICIGNTATLTAGGAITYTWTNPSSTNTVITVSPSTTTNYVVTGTDGNNCVNTQTVSLTVNALPNISATPSSSAICAGTTASLTAGGAITYTWTNPASTNTVIAVNPTSTTDYVVTGTDGNNCSNTQTVTVTVNQLPTITASTITNVSCFGLNNGSVIFTTAAGTPTYVIAGTNVSGTTATGLAPANYTYTVTDAAGCINTTILAITEPTAALLSSAAETATNTSCTSADGVATVTITGGTSGFTINPSSGVVSGNTITGLNTGVHTFTVTDANGCTSTNSVNISGATGITSTLTAQSNVLCFGNSTASVTVLGFGEASGTYNYTLTNTGTGLPVANNTTGVFTNLPAGSYSVHIVGGVSNCVSSQNITITQPSAALSLTGITANSVICNGGSAAATATISGGVAPYTYIWASNTNTTTSNTTSSVTYPAGTYSVDITDGNGCALATQNFTINEAPVLTIASVATTTTGCGLANGTATVNVNGGWSSYTYTITDSGNSVVSNTNTATGLPAGTYITNVADALGCSTQTTFTVVNPITPTLSISSNSLTICVGETTTLNPTGAVSYSLNGTPFTSITTETASPTVTTVYNVTGTDASNCVSAPLTVTVNVNALPTISLTASSAAICAGQSATLAASGADTYTWSSSANTTATEVVNPSAQTVYTAQGTNTLTGCTSNVAASYTVNVNALPTATITNQNNVLCFGQANGSVSLTTSPSSAVVSPTTTGLSEGVHTFTVNENGCISTITATITGPSAPLSASVSNTTTNTSCSTPNGSYTVTVSGGTPNYTYTSASTNTTGIFVNQGTGIHNISIVDGNGCTYSVTAIIPGANTPSIAATTQTNVLCNGGSNGAASINVINGTPTYTYSWSNNSGLNSNTQTNLPVGTYTVTAIDQGSCTVSQVFVITEPNAINAITSNVTAPCVGQSNGVISIEINGGTPNYQIVWNPNGNVSSSGNSSTINDIAEGQYIATITDANACLYQYPVQLVAADGIGCTLIIPEIFSPNGDGKNDTWEIKGLENYPNNNVTVFNRWGDQVFKAEPYKNDWDGTNTGDKSVLGKGPLPVGTYYFILDLGNGDKPISGYVQLTK